MWEESYMATKYPIILVHGIVLKDFKLLRAFGRIEDILREDGNAVYISRIDGFGTVENNAEQLKMEVMQILSQTGADKVNIIAHSKGGLDSKYMIGELGMENRVASLTTLCTPHKGSPIATNLLRLPHWMLKYAAFWVDLAFRLVNDKHPDSYAVCRQLAQTDENEMRAVAFSEKVYCQSYSTKLEKSRDDFVMGVPLMFSRYFEKRDSDGLVSAESSEFENYRGKCTDISVSHTEIVDFLPKKRKREKIFIFYTDLCRELAQMGF